MQKYISRTLLGLGCCLAVLLGGCFSSATPNCSDSDTLKLLDQIVNERAQNYWRLGKSGLERVDLKVRSIQTLAHDKDADSYTCRATLEFRLKTNKKGNPVKKDIEYNVYAITDDDANFGITTSGVQEALVALVTAFMAGWK